MKRNFFLILTIEIIILFLFNEVKSKKKYDYEYEYNNNNNEEENNNEKKTNKIEKNIYQFLHLPPWSSKSEIESAFKEKLRLFKKYKANDLELKNLYKAYIDYEKEFNIKGQKTFFSLIYKTIKEIIMNIVILYLCYYFLLFLTKINNIRGVSFSFILAFLIIDNTIPNYFPNFYVQLIVSVLLGFFINKLRNMFCSSNNEKKKNINKDLKEKAKKLENEIKELNKQNNNLYNNEKEEREMLEKKIELLEKMKRDLEIKNMMQKNKNNDFDNNENKNKEK